MNEIQSKCNICLVDGKEKTFYIFGKPRIKIVMAMESTASNIIKSNGKKILKMWEWKLQHQK